MCFLSLHQCQTHITVSLYIWPILIYQYPQTGHWYQPYRYWYQYMLLVYWLYQNWLKYQLTAKCRLIENISIGVWIIYIGMGSTPLVQPQFAQTWGYGGALNDPSPICDGFGSTMSWLSYLLQYNGIQHNVMVILTAAV